MAFNLPVPDGEQGATFLLEGLKVGSEVIPYTDIKEFVCTDDEVEVKLHNEERESLVFIIEEGCSHQLLDLETFVHTHMMQKGVAQFDEAKENIVNAPKFNTKKIRKSFTKAYSFGA